MNFDCFLELDGRLEIESCLEFDRRLEKNLYCFVHASWP